MFKIFYPIVGSFFVISPALQLTNFNEPITNYADKVNISQFKIKDFKVNLEDIENEELLIKEEVFWSLVDNNQQIEELTDVVTSILYDDPSFWRINNLDFEKPNSGEEISHEGARVIATGTNPYYKGSFSFNVTYNSGKVYPSSIYLTPNYKNTEIGNELNDESKWLATRGSTVVIDIENYAKDEYDFMRKFEKLNFNFYAKHEDNSRYGDGLILESEYNITIPTNKIFERNRWIYSNQDINDPQRGIFNVIDENHSQEKKENEGYIYKHSRYYSRNQSHSAEVLDYFYSSTNKQLNFSLITVSGKYGHWANAADVQSKVNGTFKTVSSI